MKQPCWSGKKKFKTATTRSAKVRLIRANPGYVYAAKLVALYKANPENEDAQKALRIALEMKAPRTRLVVNKALIKKAEQDLEEARKSYIALVKYGYSTWQQEAADKLLELAAAETDNAIALEMLKPITMQTAYKTEETAELIWDRVKAKPEEADLESLTVVGHKAGPTSKSAAFEALLEHHRDHEDFADVLAVVPEEPNAGFEALVKEIFKTSEGDLQTHAAISLTQYILVRDRSLLRSKLSDEQLATRDQEILDLKELLKTVDDDSELYEEAQAELFAIEHLWPGIEAMDIVGTDLNGSELKLSDYRGKVVFLDFWGDW